MHVAATHIKNHAGRVGACNRALRAAADCAHVGRVMAREMCRAGDGSTKSACDGRVGSVGQLSAPRIFLHPALNAARKGKLPAKSMVVTLRA